MFVSAPTALQLSAPRARLTALWTARPARLVTPRTLRLVQAFKAASPLPVLLLAMRGPRALAYVLRVFLAQSLISGACWEVVWRALWVLQPTQGTEKFAPRDARQSVWAMQGREQIVSAPRAGREPLNMYSVGCPLGAASVRLGSTPLQATGWLALLFRALLWVTSGRLDSACALRGSRVP